MKHPHACRITPTERSAPRRTRGERAERGAAVTRGRWYREPIELLTGAWREVRLGVWRLAAVHVSGQLLLAVVAAPVLRRLFAESLRAAGLAGVQAADLGRIVTVPLSAGRIVGIVVPAQHR